MKKNLLKIVGQLQYEISLLGLDMEELTGVTIRTDELKDYISNVDYKNEVTCIDDSVDGLTLGSIYKELHKKQNTHNSDG